MNVKEKKVMCGQKGQSIVEYILMIAGVIIILLIFLGRGGFFQQSYNGVIDLQGNDMSIMADDIFP